MKCDTLRFDWNFWIKYGNGLVARCRQTVLIKGEILFSKTPLLFFPEVPMPRKNSQFEADLQRALSTLCEIECAVDEDADS